MFLLLFLHFFLCVPQRHNLMCRRVCVCLLCVFVMSSSTREPCEATNVINHGSFKMPLAHFHQQDIHFTLSSVLGGGLHFVFVTRLQHICISPQTCSLTHSLNNNNNKNPTNRIVSCQPHHNHRTKDDDFRLPQARPDAARPTFRTCDTCHTRVCVYCVCVCV